MRALIVDLAFFPRYPSLAVGYLTAVLRQAGIEVEAFSPLAVGVASPQREGVESLKHHLARHLAFTTRSLLVELRQVLRQVRETRRRHRQRRIIEHLRGSLQSRPDILLISTYLERYGLCADLARLARDRGIPVLVGGPAFRMVPAAEAWCRIPGVTAVVGGEVEPYLPALVRDTVRGGDLTVHPGVFLPDGRRGPPAPPLGDLDAVPVPDFGDFPWGVQPLRVVPLMTARGCGWNRCTFCTDRLTANAQTFRSRSLDGVLAELELQASRYGTRNFILLDLSLNSELSVWEGLIEQLPRRLPGARWVCGVNVGMNGARGLNREHLAAARAAGLMRITTGIETASTRLLEQMQRNVDLDTMSRFLHHASQCGVSVRTTLVQGYPGEQSEDLAQTTEFLQRHSRCIDRVRLNRFEMVLEGTLHQRYKRSREAFPGFTVLGSEPRKATVRYRYEPAHSRRYRRQLRHLVHVVHLINRRALHLDDQAFDGLM
ncbi:MAG: radical SAM protein [Planctomycetota bacterium]